MVRMACLFLIPSGTICSSLGGAIMHLHHAIALAAAVLIGFGVKLIFFPAPAEADASGVKSSSMNVLQMHHKGLPVQKMSDMTFVFSDD